MASRNHKVTVIVGLILLILLVLLAFWIAHPSGPRIGVAFTTAHGHFPEPALVVGEQITILWVTNGGRAAISLEMPYVQYENAAGRLVRDQGASWNQKGYSADLSPGGVAWLANGFDPDRKRLKFVFEYRRSAGPLGRAVSKAIGVLPLKRLPQRSYDWLRRNGMVDGIVYGHYEGPWIANSQGGANGRQPSGSDTNRTSAAAASRRSP